MKNNCIRFKQYNKFLKPIYILFLVLLMYGCIDKNMMNNYNLYKCIKTSKNYQYSGETKIIINNEFYRIIYSIEYQNNKLINFDIYKTEGIEKYSSQDLLSDESLIHYYEIKLENKINFIGNSITDIKGDTYSKQNRYKYIREIENFCYLIKINK